MLPRRYVALLGFVLLAVAATDTDAEHPWQFEDIKGKMHIPFKNEKTRAIVLVFVTTDCPISNYYQPTLAKLTTEFAPKGVEFFFLHSDPDTTPQAAAHHAKAFKLVAPVVLDRDQRISRRVKARITPEVFVIEWNDKIRYQGRIDDLYVGFGQRRREPTTHDLKDALQALITGEKIKHPKTKAIGCYIPSVK